jgi:thymidylate synthase (FAD)
MNEISRRYVDSEPEFYVPEVWRGRAKDKKQGSEGVVALEYHCAHHGKHINDWWQEEFDWSENYAPEYSLLDKVQDVTEDYLSLYNTLLKAGVAPEMARMVLPQSVYTEWYWSGSMDAFANMCVLRLKEDTQYETRLVAQQIDKVMQELYPVSWQALVHG